MKSDRPHRLACHSHLSDRFRDQDFSGLRLSRKVSPCSKIDKVANGLGEQCLLHIQSPFHPEPLAARHDGASNLNWLGLT